MKLKKNDETQEHNCNEKKTKIVIKIKNKQTMKLENSNCDDSQNLKL